MFDKSIDVGDESSYKSAVTTVTEMAGDQGLNVLFNNAGILPHSKFEKVTAEEMRLSYEVNCIGPLMITQVGGVAVAAQKKKKLPFSHIYISRIMINST